LQKDTRRYIITFFQTMNSPYQEYSHGSHVRWDCTYHIVICPKFRKRIIYGKYKEQLWNILNDLLRELKIEKLEGHLMPDHIHFQLKIPPSVAVCKVIGTLKGKSAIRLHNKYANRPIRTTNKAFWSVGYFVRTTGLDIDMINRYIRNQEEEDKAQDWDQMDMSF
jgi:putative transposase